MTPKISVPCLVVLLGVIQYGFALQTQEKNKFNHAYVLQDLETYDPAGQQYYNQQAPANQQQLPVNQQQQPINQLQLSPLNQQQQPINQQQPLVNQQQQSPVNQQQLTPPIAPNTALPGSAYNNNPYLPRPPSTTFPNVPNPSLQVTNAPIQPAIIAPNEYVTMPSKPLVNQPQQVLPTAPVTALPPQIVPVTPAPIQAAPPAYTPDVSQNSIPPSIGYGPHIYSATQYSGQLQSWTDVLNNPLIILVKSPNGFTYDMAYVSNGLNHLERDENSLTISHLLLRNSEKIGVVYPSNGFPLKQFPDFPIGSLILPQDLSLEKIYNFYPRYIPILYLYTPQEYYKVQKETQLQHLGQYKYELRR